MNQLKLLRRTFRTQLRAREFLAAGLTGGLILAFALITADFSSWWFDVMPWLTSSSTWVKTQDSWDLFVYVFIGVNVFGYLLQIQAVLLDRHNGHILVRLSEQELDTAAITRGSLGKPSALLGARRRALESLFRSDPGLSSLAVLIVALVALGHPVSAILLMCFGAFVVLYFRRMVAEFTALNEPREGDDGEALDGNPDTIVETQALPQAIEPEPIEALEELSRDQRRALRQELRAKRATMTPADHEIERQQRARARAEERLVASANRMFLIINRPIVRLRISWPILVAAVVAVAGVATLTISDMANAGQLPQQATLLIVLLVLTSRSCLTLAQHWEDLSFFTASLVRIHESDTGQESL
jgi:hypothetical protein